MKAPRLFVFALFLALLSAVPVFSQNNLTLGEALKETSSYMGGRIPAGSRVAVLNIASGSKAVSDYILDELETLLVNDTKLTLVDRRTLELLQQEMNFQMSGEVSGETAQAIGRKLGAQSIISGSLEPLGDMYRLQIQALEVQSARIQGMRNFTLAADPVLPVLSGRANRIRAAGRDIVPLDAAAALAGKYLRGRIARNSKVVVLNIDSESPALSAYIRDAITADIVNDEAFIVVDRRNLELLQQELNFQMSGEVSAETAQAIGKKLGAQSIVSGKVEPLGDTYRLHTRAIEVETAKIQGMHSILIGEDAVLLALVGSADEIRETGGTLTLGEALKETTSYMGGRIPAGSRVAVLNIASDAEAISDYILDELENLLVNNGKLTIVDRRTLELLRQEMNFQMSGHVSDETAQAIGRKLGAQSIISGSLEARGGMYRLQIQALEVQSARVQGMRNFSLAADPVLSVLSGRISRLNLADQNAAPLEAATALAGKYLRSRITPDSKVVVLNIDSGSATLSAYIRDAITADIVNDGAFVVVDRRNLELLQQEMNFQMSGEVSAETAQAIGKKLGAQSIVSGKVELLGYVYRLRTRAVEVETAKIQGMHSIFIEEDDILLALAGAMPVPDDELWKTKRLYAGIRPGLSLHSYDTGGTAFAGESPKNSVSFDLAAQASWQIFKNFALQAEFILSSDSMSVSPSGVEAFDEYGNFLYPYDTTFTFSSRSLLIPFLVKGTWRPDIFSVSIFGGVYFSLPLGNIKRENSFYGTSKTGSGSFPLGAAVGGSVGMKTGPGVLFLDIRYMTDLQSTKYQGEALYKRSIFAFGIGYEMGFY